MTAVLPTGSMISGSLPRRQARHMRLVPDVDDGPGWDRTPMDLGSTPAGLRDAVTMFSGALDEIGRTTIAVVTNFNGQMTVLGTIPRLAMPFSFIGVPAAPGQVNEMSDVLEAFEQVQAELCVTQKQMFKATGIKHRTYHSWKRKAPDARPRAASQGRFWQLVDVLDDLRDAVDRPLGQWLNGAPERLSAFLSGRFDDLVDLAVNRPPYPKRSVGDSVHVGIAEDIDIPIIPTGKTNIIDVEDGV